MAKWWDSLIGLLAPDGEAPAYEAPDRAPPAVILGGNKARELCMLPTETGPDYLANITSDRTKRIVQVKADGINAVYIDGRIVCGRTGVPLNCALHCQPGLVRLERAFGHSMVFLGEYVADAGFNATLAEQAKGIGEGVFWLYDALPYGAWLLGKEYEVRIERRLDQLRATYVATQPGMFVGMLDWWELTGQETVAKAREVWALGFEGLVEKEAGSGYIRERSRAWRKIKERHRMECHVLDVLHKNGALAGVILKGPGPMGGKPLRMSLARIGATERETIERNNSNGTPMVAQIEFELTVGAERTVRAPTWIRLMGGRDAR